MNYKKLLFLLCRGNSTHIYTPQNTYVPLIIENKKSNNFFPLVIGILSLIGVILFINQNNKKKEDDNKNIETYEKKKGPLNIKKKNLDMDVFYGEKIIKIKEESDKRRLEEISLIEKNNIYYIREKLGIYIPNIREAMSDFSDMGFSEFSNDLKVASEKLLETFEKIKSYNIDYLDSFQERNNISIIDIISIYDNETSKIFNNKPESRNKTRELQFKF
jgi:hypothetical protein